MDDDRFGFLRRLVAAAPDAALAALFLWCWIEPLAWRKTLVAELMLVMLVEFLVVHSGPFFGMLVMGDTVTTERATRLKILLGLGAIYLLFAGGMSAAFESWGPVLLFAWLIGAKLVAILAGRGMAVREQTRQMALWALSVLFYLGAVFATVMLPVPKLGLVRHGHFYGIPGSGEWVSHPNTVVAAGFLYFGALALVKLLENPTWWSKWAAAQATHSRKSSSAASR
ncbi:MAG: hypothetical protein AMJ64_10135 [Betaproteobacteria bacterium SG8_39]|nr:MAG: hypothetical protein AMJ64_10135 [Betaproteobacteria bacterium SG8_39]